MTTHSTPLVQVNTSLAKPRSLVQSYIHKWVLLDLSIYAFSLGHDPFRQWHSSQSKCKWDRPYSASLLCHVQLTLVILLHIATHWRITSEILYKVKNRLAYRHTLHFTINLKWSRKVEDLEDLNPSCYRGCVCVLHCEVNLRQLHLQNIHTHRSG